MTEQKPEYDQIGKQYKQATQRPLRRYSYEPTIRAYLPNLKGKKVLDLACGDGVITRMIRDLGAREVVGLDISKEMIELAKAQDSTRIKYAQKDCMQDNLAEFGKFDLVTGMMFLHYAPTREVLENAVQNIRNSLNPNGTFYGMLVNPDLVLAGNKSYGVDIPIGHKEEGQKVSIALSDFEGNKFCDVKDFFWKRESFEKPFQRLGFETEWLPGIVSKEGIDKCGSKFWETFKRNPIYVMIKAKIR